MREIVETGTKSHQWEKVGLRWFAASCVGVGVTIGAALSLGLLRFWRPDKILGVCGLIGFVVFLVGTVGSVFSYKSAEWEKDDADRTK